MMSALDDILKYGNATPNINEWITWSSQARSELAQLRDDSLLLIGSNRLLSEIGEALGCTPDATILNSIATLRSTVAEQARQLEEALPIIQQATKIISEYHRST